MKRVYNFSAGPSMMPEAVLNRAREELLDYAGSGMSVMEMSHRGKEFMAIAAKAEADLRELMGVPENYKVLFLQGGATTQFAMVPVNLLRGKTSAAYVETGLWSEKAVAEAKRFCEVKIAASSKSDKYLFIPDRASWHVDPDVAYLHYTSNETIGGVEFPDTPDAAGLPLVCDMSSNILSRPIDVSRFAVIYAGAQKNLGPAGITIVLVRDDVMGEALPHTPSLFDYRAQAEGGSMINTPPTYNWYLLGLMLDWIRSEGGLAAIGERNARKAAKLYGYIDASDFYSNPVDPAVRSRMNVPFRLRDAALEKTFSQEAKTAGLVTLDGHRSVGGMRASIYNAMPEAGVDALISFMGDFERRYG
jgi:phosphoserine aminotransferase